MLKASITWAGKYVQELTACGILIFLFEKCIIASTASETTNNTAPRDTIKAAG